MTLVRSVWLPCTVARAFELFTGEVGAWWPPERRHAGDGGGEMFLLASGRFYERAGDGREVELGRVRAWEPPARLLLDFYPGTDADHPTEVEGAFAAEGEGARVTVTHRATAASAALFGPRAPRYAASWDVVLPALARAAGELVSGN